MVMVKLLDTEGDASVLLSIKAMVHCCTAGALTDQCHVLHACVACNGSVGDQLVAASVPVPNGLGSSFVTLPFCSAEFSHAGCCTT